MSRKITRIRLGLLAALVAALVAFTLYASASHTVAGPIGMVCLNGATFNLETTTGYISTPDGNSILMWSYVNAGAPDNGAFQTPGPTLCVEENTTVTVNLTNNLAEPVSIVFPGQIGVSASMVSGTGVTGLFTLEANAGETVRYTFLADEPGTYLYESGTDPAKQVQMGLYGALIVRPELNNGVNWYAYNDPDTEYAHDREYLLVIHEIDPELHFAVERGLPYDSTTFHPRYWTINGRSFPDSIAANFAPWLPGQPYSSVVYVQAADPDAPGLPALIRYANAGLANHPFHPHGNHLTVIARDGRLLLTPTGDDASVEAFTRTIGSGQTYDLFFWWLNLEGWASTGPQIPPDAQPVPGLQNLVFKDGYSFYSGSPYLGETGDFPVSVTVNNACGEFYFPWHSHAVNEFQNFNEGFGGLATVVRVDPPGGCP